MGSARLGSQWAGSGRSPAVNGQVLLLLLRTTVALSAVVRKMPRSGWDGKLNSPVALPCRCLASQWCAGDLPGQDSQLYFTSAGEKTEQVVSGVLNPVFFLSTKFSLEVFPLR